MHHLDQRAITGPAMMLISHLRGHFGFFGGQRELSGFVDGARQRLLRVSREALLQRGHCDWGVHVIGVLTVTASIRPCSLSNSSLQSVYRRAWGHFSAAVPYPPRRPF